MTDWVTTTGLLAELKAGEEIAWQKFVERFRKPVIALALRMGLSPPAADDAAQETMLTLLNGLRQGAYQKARGRLSSWLFGIANMKILEARRAGMRARRNGAGADPAAIEAIPENEARRSWDESWAQTLLDHCLAQVKREVEATTFRVFELILFEKKTPAAVATELGMTRNAVFIAKHRVLARIRALKTEFESEE